jgi:hypothetical protein
MPSEPTTLPELFKFYHEYVKLLYASVSSGGILPQETLFELNAALDHISRYWVYKELEGEAVKKAYSHLKRSCLDVFKIKVNNANDQFKYLRTIDTSVLDNGEFDRNLIALHHEIRIGATNARRLEGESKNDTDGAIRAFELWQPVYEKCIQLETDFVLHPKLNWAKKRARWSRWKERLIGFVFGILAAFIVALATPIIADLQNWIRQTYQSWFRN